MSDIIANDTDGKSASNENAQESSGTAIPPEIIIQRETENCISSTPTTNETDALTYSLDIDLDTHKHTKKGVESGELEGTTITVDVNAKNAEDVAQNRNSGTTSIPVSTSRNTENRAEVQEHSGILLSSIALKECTVKEILNGILDCKVFRTSSTQERQFISKPASENSAEEVPESCPGTSSRSSECSSSRMVSVKEILGELMDYTVFKKSTPVEHVNNASLPTTSREQHNHMCQSELEFQSRGYQIFRATGTAGLINSSSALHSESYIHRPLSLKSTNQILPSYSTVLRLGPKRSVKSVESFIPRLPPPSYSEVEGLWEDSPTLISSDSVILGPDPIYIVCPGCRTVVVTDVERERSNVTHLVALILCLFFCWPCCLLPYCLKSCNYSYHSCPNCRHYFGVYNPF